MISGLKMNKIISPQTIVVAIISIACIFIYFYTQPSENKSLQIVEYENIMQAFEGASFQLSESTTNGNPASMITKRGEGGEQCIYVFIEYPFGKINVNDLIVCQEYHRDSGRYKRTYSVFVVLEKKEGHLWVFGNGEEKEVNELDYAFKIIGVHKKSLTSL